MDPNVNYKDLLTNFQNGAKNAQTNVLLDSQSKSNKNKMHIDSDQDQNQLFKMLNLKASQAKLTQQKNKQNSRKKMPVQPISTPDKQKEIMKMEIESKVVRNLTFDQLPEQIDFYLNEVYQFDGNNLFITGVMQNGQTINIVSLKTQRQLYFALKRESEQSDQISVQFQERAKKQIDSRLKTQGVNQFHGQFQERQYVFQIEDVPRSKRPYYQVRYPFSNKSCPKPDWQGETYRYVFGTTYTPLELFIINTQIKGPCWVRIEKQHLSLSKKYTQNALCAQIQFAQWLTPIKQKTTPPNLRVMSVSIKSVIPSQLSKKKLFPNANIDELNIYAISYSYCEDYCVQMKPLRYNTQSKTFYLNTFGNMKQKDFIGVQNEKDLTASFASQLIKLDPDIIVCHDSSKILDTLIQRTIQLTSKQYRPKLGRLIFYSESSNNQHSRISTAIAGRLLVDTYLHAKDMIRSVDYELQSMAKHIKPERPFKGMAQQQTKNFLEQGKTFYVLKKCRDQAQITFALMNHLQVLQITRQLSNICGIIWRRSLQIQRAERNEYLIMHECLKRQLIIPDKFKSYKNENEEDETDHKKYMGGMVLQPKKGMYSDFILLLDFNSLYPSIIRQYNICFSVIQRPRIPLSKFYKAKDGKKSQKAIVNNQDQDVNPPEKQLCKKQKWGFLPQIIDKIVNQRKKCKAAMKNASLQKCIILDIQQKCYKLVANSIYGCLGFSISRFYSKPMAALITRMGRQALQKANDIVSARGGVSVIYGDTDSLMIQPTSLTKQTDKQKLFEIKIIADDLKKAINKQYSMLQIDIDGIFKPIILLMKKKYVANKLLNYDRIINGLDQKLEFNLEYKGIEVVRRDGCEASRASLKKILQILMNSNKTDPAQIYEDIYEFAKNLNIQLKQNAKNSQYKQFLFSKMLSKKPKQYHKGQTIAHVKVALDRMRNGQREETLVNHTIYYLVCKPKNDAQDSLAKRCFDDKSFERSIKFPDKDGPLQIDIEYYKSQIIQPWMRIFTHLPQFNQDKLYQFFEIPDSHRKKIKKQVQGQKQDADQGIQDFLADDIKDRSNKFNDMIGQSQCPGCKNFINLTKDGVFFQRCSICVTQNLIPIISNKISSLIKSKTDEYYSNKQVCDCGKKYELIPISRCCKSFNQKRSTIPYEVHSFLYICKQICQTTVRKLRTSGNQDHKRAQADMSGFQNISRKVVGKFLRNSEFENVQGIMAAFKI